MGKYATLMPVLLLGSCVTYGGSFCEIATQSDHTVQDALVVSPQLAEWLAKHNQKGAALCGWEPDG